MAAPPSEEPYPALDLSGLAADPAVHFYRAMHYSAKRGLAIACRLSVCLSVCDVGGSGPQRLKILEIKCANN